MGIVQPTAATYAVAATYERVSTYQQFKYGGSMTAQHRDGGEFAAANGWTLPEALRFSDTDSGAEWDLPGLGAMLAAAKRGEFRILIVPHPDRWARDTVKALVIEEQLASYGVRLVFIAMQLDDSPEGKLLRTQLYSFAEYERTKIRLRTLVGKAEKLRRGEVMGVGGVLYGFVAVKNARGRTVGLARDEALRPTIRRIFADALSLTAQDLADALVSDGVAPPRAGGTWTENFILKLINNPAYHGRYPYGRRVCTREVGPDGKKRVKARWRDPAEVQYVDVPAHVSRAQWDAAQAALADRRSLHSRARSGAEDNPFALRGMLTCGHCGRPLATRRHGAWRYYLCLRHVPSRARLQGTDVCPLPSVPAEDELDARGEPRGLEAEAWALLRATLLDTENLAAGLRAARRDNVAADRRRERIDILRGQIATARRALDKQVRELLMAEDGSATEDSLRARGRELEAQIGEREAALAELEATPVIGLSDADVAEVEAFAARMREGLERADTPAKRRRVYELLQLRGTVREDREAGIGLRRGRFTIEWAALVPLAHKESNLLNLECLWASRRDGPSPGVRLLVGA